MEYVMCPCCEDDAAVGDWFVEGQLLICNCKKTIKVDGERVYADAGDCVCTDE